MQVGISVTIPGVSAPECIAAAAEAARCGAAMVAFGEARYDPLALAAAAAVTTPVPLVAAVARWDRPPQTLARAAAAVAEASTQPYRLGVGPGPLRGPAPGALARMRTYLDDLRAACGDDPSLRLLLAAAGPGMARLAGETADGVVLSRVHSPQRLQRTLLPAVSEGERGQRRIERIVLVRCAVTDTVADGIAAIRWALSEYEVPLLARLLADDGPDLEAAVTHWRDGDRPATASAIPADVVRGLALVGPPEACLDQLTRYVDADTVLLFPCGSSPAAALRGSLSVLRRWAQHA